MERAGFNEEQVEDYEASFKKYDHDGGGSLSLKEINPLLEELGKAPKNKRERERLLQMMKEIDDDDTGEIEFPEFLQLMRKFSEEKEGDYVRNSKCIAAFARSTA